MKKKYFILKNNYYLLLLFISFLSFGQSPQTFNGNGTFIVPAGVTSITVQAWGAGGAGGGSNNAAANTARGGAGGGGGAYALANFTVIPGTSLSVIVGAGGTGVSAGNGNSGGFSTITEFSTTIYAVGGNGGVANTTGNTPNGGAGGTIANSVGTTRTAGVTGQNGATGNGINSGDGGAGGNGGAGAASIDNSGNSANGNLGSQPGGGGSGSRTSQSAGNFRGGNGGNGQVIITYNCPTSAGTLSGNQYLCRYSPNQTTTFSSTVLGGTWSSINTGVATVNATTGVVTAISTGTATIRYTVASSGCTTRTVDRFVYVANGPGAGPNSLTGSQSQCQSTTTTYTITPDPYSYSYLWDYVDGGSGATITPAADGLSATVVFGSNATSGNIRVQSVNACGNGGGGKYLWVAIAPSSNGGTLPSNISGCANSYISNIGLSGYVGLPVRWESSTDNFVNNIVSIANTNNNMNISGLTQTTYYRAVVQNSPCSATSYSSVCIATITPIPVAAGTITGTATVCQGSSGVSYSVPSITNATSYVWSYSGSGVTITNSATRTPTISFASNATSGNLTVYGVNSCGNGLISANYAVKINTIPVITPNKVDETCAISNNGSISPVLSGGLTNIRYIKLTQKYNVDAWQQVAEIEAYEIFTGTNVALASSGSTATSSTNYQNDATNYGPQKAIDGNNSGNNNFWHSGNTNINEYIIVDLKTGKNLDRIRIYNRTDCCSQRGQNMLLELFDASNNFLFAKTIDLRGAIGTENYVDVNVLDVLWTDGATTLNRIGLDAGTYTLNYADAGGCSTTSSIVIGTTNVTPATPTVGARTQPTCSVQTGSVVLNSLPASGNWTIAASPATIGLIGLTGTGVTTTVSGLAAGTTYTFTVSNGSCPSVSSTDVVINAAPALISWNGTTWLPGLPTINNRVEFTADYSSGSNSNAIANVDACSCIVKNNAKVVFNGGHTLKVVNELQVVAGSLTFENNASLVQINDLAINSGDINYKRYTTKVKRYDFTYWSSPVAGQTLYNLSPLTLGDKYYGYNSAAGGYEIYYNGNKTMDAGIGYLVRAPQTFDIDIAKIDDSPVFKGKPNNGKITLSSLLGDNVYLLGNPYPSPLDADQFLNKNAAVLEGTLYFWTHNSGPNANYYTANDYASYNRTGGVATTPTKTAATTGGPAPTGEIASGQGFFAPTKAAGNVEYNNDMRLFNKTTTMDNSQFFKVTNTAKESITTKIEKSRVWLNLTNKEGAFKQALVGYISGATNDYDGAFDGLTFDANEFLDFYSINKGINLSIQGRALPFEKKDTIALGYRSAIKGEFQINIDQTDGALITQNVFLEDTDLKVLHDLKKRPYTFNTEVGTFNTRFVLRYVDKNTIGEVIPEPEIPADLNTAVVVSVLNGKITINSPTALIDKVIVYDLAGRKRYQNMKVLNKSLIVQNILSSHQVLVVKITLENGKIDTAKILY